MRSWMSLGGWLALAACGPQLATPSDDATSSSNGSSEGGVTSSDGADVDGGPTSSSSTPDDDTAADESTGAAVPACDQPSACDEGCLQWQSIFATDDDDPNTSTWIDDVGIGPDGSIVAVATRDATAPHEHWLLGFGPDGTATFEQRLVEPLAEGNAEEPSLAIASDGTIAVVLVILTPGGDQSRTTGVDVRLPNGSPSWSDVLTMDAPSVDGFGIGFADDASLLVTGVRGYGPVDLNGFVRRYFADGSLAWDLGPEELELGYSGVSVVESVAPGVVLLAGWSDHDGWLARLGLDGDLEWTTNLGDRTITRIAIAPDGGFFATGWLDDGTPYGAAWVGRFDDAGVLQWSDDRSSTLLIANFLDGLEVTADGRIFVSGVHADARRITVRFVQEVDCAGQPKWEWAYPAPRGDYGVRAGGLDWNPTVGLIVGGGDYLATYEQRGFLARLLP